MSQYIVIPNPVEGVDRYLTRPDFTKVDFINSVLYLVQESKTELEVTTQWFEIWDMIMSWMAMSKHIPDPTLPRNLIGEVRGAIRGTVLNRADLVTDISNDVVECARLNFRYWGPIVRMYPTGTYMAVADIANHGIIIEVKLENQVA